MRRTILVCVLLLGGCAASRTPVAYGPELPPLPEARGLAHPRPRPAEKAASAPDATPAAVLRESATLHDEATRYVAWPKSKPANIYALIPLTRTLSRTVAAMQASRSHGRYGALQVAAARRAVDALDDFLTHKQD